MAWQRRRALAQGKPATDFIKALRKTAANALLPARKMSVAAHVGALLLSCRWLLS